MVDLLGCFRRTQVEHGHGKVVLICRADVHQLRQADHCGDVAPQLCNRLANREHGRDQQNAVGVRWLQRQQADTRRCDGSFQQPRTFQRGTAHRLRGNIEPRWRRNVAEGLDESNREILISHGSDFQGAVFIHLAYRISGRAVLTRLPFKSRPLGLQHPRVPGIRLCPNQQRRDEPVEFGRFDLLGVDKEASQGVEPGNLPVQTLLQATEALRSNDVETLTQLALIQLIVGQRQHDRQCRADQQCQDGDKPR